MIKGDNKRGQIAIFVIVALVITGAILVIFAYPKLSGVVSQKEITPVQYLKDCISPSVREGAELLSKQGGDENPVGYIEYLDVKVKYLCYVSGYYKTCLVMQPLLMSHFADELSRMLTKKIETCANNLEAEYEKRGYSVEMGKLNSSIILAPGKIVVLFTTPMTITKEQEAKRYEKFDVMIESKIYDLLGIATEIVDYEAAYGDSETTLFLSYYPDLKMDKKKFEDGVKIYILTNVITNEMFQFATRSLAWPAGYGL